MYDPPLVRSVAREAIYQPCFRWVELQFRIPRLSEHRLCEMLRSGTFITSYSTKGFRVVCHRDGHTMAVIQPGESQNTTATLQWTSDVRPF